MRPVLTAAQMREVDRRAIAAGASGRVLMERAGSAVTDVAAGMAAGRRVVVACGPGNNGGDGFVVARLLAEAGHAVELGLLGPRESLRGDAALAAGDWPGEARPLDALDLSGGPLVFDALFGTGLGRDLSGEAASFIEQLNASGAAVLAVDLPSGVDGDTGAIRGTAVRAERTVALAGLKPGHMLLPGRDLCGAVTIADIGLPEAALMEAGAALFGNEPALWRGRLPTLGTDGHKYDRGHALVLSGPMLSTGAARLAARAALRAGAGLVTLGSPRNALLVNATHLTAIMLRPCDGPADLAEILEDPRFSAVALGPGYGVGEATREAVRTVARARRGLVLDADAITSFRGESARLAEALAGCPAVLTPHGGEFARLFEGTPVPDLPSKIERARAAAGAVGAVMVLKGADTVVAAPDGRAAINAHASPHLATAGSGDVLTGLVAGLMAQGMPPFEAACAAVWLHGDAGLRLGPGLIAEDLPDALPGVLRALLEVI